MNPGPVLIGISGTSLSARCREHLSHQAVGGVVLFSRNFEDRAQLERLVGDIRDSRDPRPLICIDQEGGRVQRLREGFTRLPPLGTEMLACGIDLSFAPVLDLDRGSSVIGDRAFSGDPAVVTRLGRAYLAGMRDSGMKTTGKHFPGHGSIRADSHVSDVHDPRSLDEIADSDMQPFSSLADSLDALMIAHVVYPEVDTLPAGYSRNWLQGVLRTDMAYQGVVVSDDLGMHAAKSAGGLAERTRLCLDAGCDLVLVCIPEDVAVLLAELDGSRTGRLPGRRQCSRQSAVRNSYGQSRRTGQRQPGRHQGMAALAAKPGGFGRAIVELK
jgi:beta-N-acetylhexosaminidase